MIAAGVVGVGAMGRHHARILAELDGCQLVGVHDTHPGRGPRIADRYGCRAYDDLEGLLREVDAVSVAVPTLKHHRVGMECIEAGCDALIEKPLAVSLEEADELVAAAETAGRVLQVGHVERYNPAVEAVMPLIDGPGFIEIDRLGSFAPRSLEVDVFLDLMIHDIDILHAVVPGEIREIRAVGVPVLSEEIDIANARLEFEGGCIANVTASRVSMNRIRKVRIFQPEAYFSVDYSAQVVEHYRLLREPDGTASIAAQPMNIDRREPLRNELLDFVECVRHRRRPRVDGAAGRRALETAMRIRGEAEIAGGTALSPWRQSG